MTEPLAIAVIIYCTLHLIGVFKEIFYRIRNKRWKPTVQEIEFKAELEKRDQKIASLTESLRVAEEQNKSLDQLLKETLTKLVRQIGSA